MNPSHLPALFCAALWLFPFCAEAASTPKAPGNAPTIGRAPIGRSVTAGGHIALSVGAAGTTPFAYQWFKDGQVLTNQARLTGATQAVFNIDPAITNDSGAYTVIITNVVGAITSAPVSITVGLLGTQLTPRGGTGLVIRLFGQKGDVYRMESADNTTGPWNTNAFVTNYIGTAVSFAPFASLGNFLRFPFDHFRPVLQSARWQDFSTIAAYGKLNQVWRIQSTTNWQDWQTVEVIVNDTGWVKVTDSTAHEASGRFYRIVPE